MNEPTFTPSAWDDYTWFQTHDRKLVKRINQLVHEILRTPFEGIGKPEPRKGDLAGYWSRRINDEQRLVYSARADNVIIVASRYHYDDQAKIQPPRTAGPAGLSRP